jgi:hypothetical protein
MKSQKKPMAGGDVLKGMEESINKCIQMQHKTHTSKKPTVMKPTDFDILSTIGI